jgi:hypothetical protein
VWTCFLSGTENYCTLIINNTVANIVSEYTYHGNEFRSNFGLRTIAGCYFKMMHRNTLCMLAVSACLCNFFRLQSSLHLALACYVWVAVERSAETTWQTNFLENIILRLSLLTSMPVLNALPLIASTDLNVILFAVVYHTNSRRRALALQKTNHGVSFRWSVELLDLHCPHVTYWRSFYTTAKQASERDVVTVSLWSAQSTATSSSFTYVYS